MGSSVVRRFAPALLATLLFTPWGVAGQGGGVEALDEIRSLSVEVTVSGGSGVVRVAGQPLADLIRDELARSWILDELPPPRGGECCTLRLDVRLVSGTAGIRPTEGFVARLELGYRERLGRLDPWVILWESEVLGSIVDPRDLPDQLRFATRELAIGFVTLYRERFPLR